MDDKSDKAKNRSKPQWLRMILALGAVILFYIINSESLTRQFESETATNNVPLLLVILIGIFIFYAIKVFVASVAGKRWRQIIASLFFLVLAIPFSIFGLGTITLLEPLKGLRIPDSSFVNSPDSPGDRDVRFEEAIHNHYTHYNQTAGAAFRRRFPRKPEIHSVLVLREWQNGAEGIVQLRNGGLDYALRVTVSREDGSWAVDSYERESH